MTGREKIFEKVRKQLQRPFDMLAQNGQQCNIATTYEIPSKVRLFQVCNLVMLLKRLLNGLLERIVGWCKEVDIMKIYKGN